MIHAIAPAVLTSLALAAFPLDNGVVLTYQGEFDAEKGDPFVTRKTFDLTLIVSDVSDAGATLHWMTDEQNRGGWHWPDRFGRVTLKANGTVEGEHLPSLLYQRPEGNSVVPLGLPLLAAGTPLAVGARWEEGRLAYEVKELGSRAGQSAWRIEAHNPYGRVRTLWAEEQSPLVIASQQRVFIGRGEQHQLKYELRDRSTLEADGLAAATAALDQFITLRDDLQFARQTIEVNWKKDQLETLKRVLPTIARPAQPPLLGRIVKAALDDTKAQKDRTGAVDALTKNAVGKMIDDLQLAELTGQPFDQNALKDKTVILHFWNYQDTPLEEPYGQVGYLDFLHRRLADDPIEVLGVIVDDRVANGERNAVVQSAKKLRAFMNLGYPILLDDGLLKQVGDPRVASAKLPLFVVLDSTGKVCAYHVGLYEVDRDHGLKQLEQAARDAAK